MQWTFDITFHLSLHLIMYNKCAERSEFSAGVYSTFLMNIEYELYLQAELKHGKHGTEILGIAAIWLLSLKEL